jgi:hypothetical protein
MLDVLGCLPNCGHRVYNGLVIGNFVSSGPFNQGTRLLCTSPGDISVSLAGPGASQADMPRQRNSL